MTRPANVPVYEQFVTDPRCILTDEHRQQLREQRGFTDETIDAFRFRSARPENAEIVQDLRAHHPEEELRKRGLLTPTRTGLVVQPQLLEPRILIPYNGDLNTVYHQRPHKLGFKDVTIQPYCAGTGGGTGDCVLAEGEFKAVASAQLGHPAIAIPGISSFAREHFDRLVKVLRDEGVTDITIVFDNEIKDDPAFPNYKPDPMKRWDTQYYATLMGRRLLGTSLFSSVQIGALPDEMRVNGKIDIDGFLAAGHTADEYQQVINQAMSPNDYWSAQPEEAHKIIGKKLRCFDLSLRLRATANGYEAIRSDKRGNEYWETVTNFTMKIVSRVEAGGQVARDVIFHNADGQDSELVRILPRDMVSPLRFQEFLYGIGNGAQQFSGRPTDLATLFDLEHSRSRDEVVYEPDHVGKIDDEDLWLFGNGMYDTKSRVWIPAQEGNVCWNGVKGYKAPLYIDMGRKRKDWKAIDKAIPCPDSTSLGQVHLRELSRMIWENFGGEDGGYDALLAFCWALGAPYSEEIFREFNCYPIMYLLGKAQSGKTTLGRWILLMSGIHIPGFNLDATTGVAVGRGLAYYSSIPVFYDECKDKALTDGRKETLFRSAYDRQPVAKGLRTNSNEMRSVVVRSVVLIGGEERSSDTALNTRCLFARFVKERNGKQYGWLREAEKTMMPKVLPWILTYGPKAEDLVTVCKEAHDEIKLALKGDARIAQNYSIPSATYHLMVDDKDEIGFQRWIRTRSESTLEHRESDAPHVQFYEDLTRLVIEERIKPNQDYKIESGRLFLVFRTCYEKWCEMRVSLRKDVPGSTSILSIIENEPWYAGKSRVRFSGFLRPCIILDLSKCPDSVRDFAGAGTESAD